MFVFFSCIYFYYPLSGLFLLMQLSKGSSSDGTGKVQEPAPTASVQPPTSSVPPFPGLANITNIEAVKRAQELAAKMGFRQDPEFAPIINCFPGQTPVDVAVPQKPTKAPVLRVDALGREIDEHGNVVNMTKPSNLSTLKVCLLTLENNYLVVNELWCFDLVSAFKLIHQKFSRSTSISKRKMHFRFLNPSWRWIQKQILILTQGWV